MDSRDWRMRIAVLDINGTIMKAGLFKDGSLTNISRLDTREQNDGEHIIKKAKEILHTLGDVDGIGISTAGQVDSEKGVIRYANSNIPGYTGMEVAGRLEKEFHVPVAVENDVNAAALGEAYYGAGIGFNDFICVTFDTGVGGAFVLEGDVYRGSSFSAGEVGAMIVHPEERQAARDMYSGCYEKYASLNALLCETAKIDGTLSGLEEILAARQRPEIKNAVDHWLEEITGGLASLIHIFNPSCVILGGETMENEIVFGRVKKQVLEQIMESYRHVMITQAALSDKAGMFGAAYLALKKLI